MILYFNIKIIYFPFAFKYIFLFNGYSVSSLMKSIVSKLYKPITKHNMINYRYFGTRSIDDTDNR